MKRSFSDRRGVRDLDGTDMKTVARRVFEAVGTVMIDEAERVAKERSITTVEAQGMVNAVVREVLAQYDIICAAGDVDARVAYARGAESVAGALDDTKAAIREELAKL